MVLGGVVAGSAAAWLLSTAGAQAAPPDVDELRHAAERLSTLPEQAADAVHGTVRKVGETLHGEQKPANPGKPAERPQSPARDDVPHPPAEDAGQPDFVLPDLGSLLSGVIGGGSGELPKPPAAEPPACAPEFQRWCERVTDWFTPPQPGELVPTLPGDVTVPPADGSADLPAALPSPAHSVVAQPAVAVEPIEQAAAADERVDSGLGSRGQPSHKNFPGKHTPLGVPGPPAATAPGSGAALAGHADGSPMAITAASTAAAVGGASTAPRSITPGPRRPGGQPGVTPD